MNDTQPRQKKKLPLWAKLLIVFASVGTALIIFVMIGISLLGSFFTGRGGERTIMKGFEKIIESEIEKSGGDVDVEFDKKGWTIRDKSSGATGEFRFDKQEIVVRDDEGREHAVFKITENLPSDFPSDVPIFSPSKVVASMVVGPGVSVTLETKSALGEVAGFYKEELPKNGWSSTREASFGNMFSGTYKKGERKLAVSANPDIDGEKVTITLFYGQQKDR